MPGLSPPEQGRRENQSQIKPPPFPQNNATQQQKHLQKSARWQSVHSENQSQNCCEMIPDAK